jgi:aspartyl-tRNA(Asn)/glutamyl-tRNA(Gln) amidotransferase subunit A
MSDDRTTGFRFGLLKGSIEEAAPGVAENTRAAVDQLREFGTVGEVELPDLPWDEAASIIIMCEAASAFEDLLDSGDGMTLTAPEDRTGLYHALTVPAIDYLKVMRLRSQGAAEMATVLSRFDALIAPAYPVTAPPAEGNFEAYFDKHPGATLSAMGNLLGLPSIAVQTGLDADGLPTSLEILSTWWAEPTVVALANAYQARTDWHNSRPPLFA